MIQIQVSQKTGKMVWYSHLFKSFPQFVVILSVKGSSIVYETEVEDIKNRWQEYTEKLHKRDLHDPDNHNGVITHLEPDILGMPSQEGLRKHHYEQS